MTDSLKEYLAQRAPLDLDRSVLEDHVRRMTESVIPEIEKDIRESEQYAAVLRYSPTSKLRPGV